MRFGNHHCKLMTLSNLKEYFYERVVQSYFLYILYVLLWLFCMVMFLWNSILNFSGFMQFDISVRF